MIGRRAYPEYKDSEIEWLGEIPEGWTARRIKTGLVIIDGGVWGEDSDSDGTIVLRSTEQTIDGKWQIDDPARRTLSASEIANALLAEGDLVITKSSGSARHIGKTTITTHEVAALKCCFSNFMERLRCDSITFPKFIYYILNSPIGREQFVYGSSTTTGLANLNSGIIGNLWAAFPQFAEQRAIAAFLDHETARIDTLVEKKERQIELLKEKRSALISHAVTKGLNPAAPMKDSRIEWLGEIPEHWGVERIKWLAKMESGHTPDRKQNVYWEGCDIPWVSLKDTGSLKDQDYISDTADNVNRLGLENSSAHILPEGVVLFTRDASIGLSAITTRPMAVSQHIIAWVCGRDVYPEYLLHVFYAMSEELERITMGSTLKTIGMPHVQQLVSPVPSIDEQAQISKFICNEKSGISYAIGKISRSIELLREYRTAIISAAVTGKIDVREEIK